MNKTLGEHIDAVFAEADKAFAKANELFDEAFKKGESPPMSSDVKTFEFRATTTKERFKLAGRFAGMALDVLIAGKASLSVKQRKK